jgi:hypothetical protein
MYSSSQQVKPLYENYSGETPFLKKKEFPDSKKLIHRRAPHGRHWGRFSTAGPAYRGASNSHGLLWPSQAMGICLFLFFCKAKNHSTANGQDQLHHLLWIAPEFLE